MIAKGSALCVLERGGGLAGPIDEDARRAALASTGLSDLGGVAPRDVTEVAAGQGRSLRPLTGASKSSQTIRGRSLFSAAH